jgi:hypothetical protein
MLDSGIADLETMQGFQIVDPHWFWMIDEQRAEADFGSPQDMCLL